MTSKMLLGRAMRGGATAVLAISIGCSSLGDSSQFGGPRYATLEQAPTTTPDEARAARATHAIQTIFLIVMENNNWSDIKASPSAPYLNSLLATGAHAENYFENASAIHPSEPNYIWLEAGDNLGILDDNAPNLNHRSTTKHLTTLLDDAQIDWKSYEEDINGADCPLLPDGLYDPKHDPMLFFDDITDDLSSGSPRCIAHVRPYTELQTDLANGTVAPYNFITPNLCDSMHNLSGCANSDSIKNGDDWLSREVPKILESTAYRTGGALFITWDESENGEFPIGMIVLSPFAKVGYANDFHYTHSAMLRTSQEILGVQPFLRDAADSPSLADFFSAYP